MRIMMLPKLIRDEETRTHCLRNCSVVIDGNNFFYDTYEDSKLPFVFGSEANNHARYLRNILNHYKNANVKCYFVFKGGSTNIVRKIQNTKPLPFDFESNYNFVPPVFIKEVCKQVLQEGHVNYTTCVMESKDDCVALAQELGCAVISNDIDFCFKKAPYIPSTTLKYTRNGIFCKEYNLKTYLQKHSLTEKKFAIFAALSDLTLFPTNHFDDLLQKWGVKDGNLYLQHKKLLQWLARNTEEDIINTVLQFLSNESEKFLNYIENILTNMNTDSKGIALDYFYNDCNLHISRSDPLWFEKGVLTQNVPIPYIDLYKHKVIRGSWVIEKKGPTDSLMPSIEIIKYAYNLLNNFDGSDFSIYQDEENYIKINADLNIKKPSYNAAESVFKNGWKDVKHLKLFEHFLVENNINLDIINKLPSESRLLIIALVYIARQKSSENIDVRKQVYCFIICHVILRVVSDKVGSLRKKNSGIIEEDAAEAMEATKKYFTLEENEVKRLFNEDNLKSMVEIQHCLAHMNYLNILCGTTYTPTIYHRNFNGTFIYKLYCDMTVYNENQFIQTLFENTPSVYKFIKKLIVTYKELV